jgi:predicted dehydrogenase
VRRLRDRLAQAGLRDRAHGSDSDADAVVVWTDRPLPEALLDRLLEQARLGGPVVVLAGSTLDRADTESAMAEAAGAWVSGASPVHDVRLRPGPHAPADLLSGSHAHTSGAHLGEHAHVVDRVLVGDKVMADVEVLLTAQLGLDAHPVATWRPSTRVLVWSLGTRPEAVDSRDVTRALVLTLRRALGLPGPAPVRVGLLGYGAIGNEHSRAVRSVAGLELAAVADPVPGRLEDALRHAPDVRTFSTAEALLADECLDLVVVSTPPSTHAPWALAALERGLHVVVEKPFALRTEEADAVLAAAAAQGRLAVVYQNRRFDPDHLAVRRLVRSGALGEVFHLETFVGGYGHPCNLWHSDEGVSGGAFYDWGSHVLDQLLDLVPDEVLHVTATNHKRRWFDVTNADHSRVTVRFATGVEAEFVHSDLAAALKPRWYVLGTLGAVVGHWRTERVVGRTDIGTLAEDVLAPADSPPRMELHAADGSVTRLATPPAPPYEFHRELAEQVQLGLPMSVTGAQSRRVLAVMEAARGSAADDGRPVAPR